MRSFDAGFYANLNAMYEHLGIKTIPTRYLFSYAKLPSWCSPLRKKEKGTIQEQPRVKSYFIHSSDNHRIPPIRPEQYGLLAWISEVVYLAVFFGYFVICCFFVPTKKQQQSQSPKRASGCESFGQYLNRIYLPRWFVHNYLLTPLAGAATCSHDQILAYPASDFISYVRRSFNKPHRTIDGGVKAVERKLSQGLKLNLGIRITSVVSNGDGNGVSISWETGTTTTPSSNIRTFDHVILAMPPNAVASIFEPLRSILANDAIPTVQVTTVVHADDVKSTIMANVANYPACGAQWIQMRSTPEGDVETIQQHPSSVLVTNNPLTYIDPASIISQHAFTRTLRTPSSREITNQIFGIKDRDEDSDDNAESGTLTPSWRNGDGNVWLVGSWCWDGLVFLEGCIVSSMRVADALGVYVPWQRNY